MLISLRIILRSYAQAIGMVFNNLLLFALSVLVLGILATGVYLLNGCSSSFESSNMGLLTTIAIATLVMIAAVVGIFILHAGMAYYNNSQLSNHQIKPLFSHYLNLRSFLSFYMLYMSITKMTLELRFANFFYFFSFSVFCIVFSDTLDEKHKLANKYKTIDARMNHFFLNELLMVISLVLLLKLLISTTGSVLNYSRSALSLDSSCMQQLPAVLISSFFLAAGVIVISWSFVIFYTIISSNHIDA